jgi:hypothetical protein
MNIRQLKNIMKEVNEPNEYILEPDNLQHPLYWIFKVQFVRVKTLFPALDNLRKPDARFDVFINGLYISTNDYIYENKGEYFYIKFKRTNFPQYDRFGNIYTLDDSDEIKINGDVEKYN